MPPSHPSDTWVLEVILKSDPVKVDPLLKVLEVVMRKSLLSFELALYLCSWAAVLI